MRANEFITELFKPGKKWQWSFTGSEEAVAVFHVGDIPYQFHAYTYADENPTAWEVEFKNAARGQSGRSTKFGLTGTGNSAEVMSTVADIMREFLQRYSGSISQLSFTADEPSRQRLYARMAQRLLPDWEIVQSGKNFTLSAPETVNEDYAMPPSAGCIIVAEDTGRWCLQQRSDTVTDPGVWSTWGGGREPGETLEQTVRRELAEESGYVGPLTLEPLHSNSQYATFIAYVPHEFEPHINQESKDWCWVEQDQLPEPMHPGLVKTLSKLNEDADTLQWLYHATYRPLLKSIRAHGLGGDRAQAKWEDSKPGVVYLARDPDVAESYAESSDMVPDEWLDQIVVLKINASQLDQSRLFADQNVQDNVSDTLEYHGIIPVSSLSLTENFTDGRVKGKSRPGRVKRAGASCDGSVADLRARAKKYGGERGRMYHWCANMKSGRNK